MAVGYLWLAVFSPRTHDAYQWPGIVAFACGLVLLPFVSRGSTRAVSGDTWCQVSALVLFGYMTGRALCSPIYYLARLDLFFILTFFGIYVVLSSGVLSRGQRSAFLGLILLVGVANTVVAFYQQAFDLTFCVRFGRSRIGFGGQLARPSGFYNQSIHLGGFLAAVSVMVIAVITFAKGAKVRAVASVLLCLVLLGLVKSQSRSGLILLGVGMVVMAGLWVCKRGRKSGRAVTNRQLVVGGLSLFVIAVFAVVAARGLKSRFGDSSAGLFGLTGRSNFWNGAIDQWFDWPVFGAGARSYHYRYLQYRPADAPFHQRDPGFAHNEYLQQGAEYGTVGVLLLAIVLVVHLANGFGSWRRIGDMGGANRTRAVLLAAALAVICAQLLHALVDFQVRLWATGVPLVFCLAILANPGGSRTRRQFSWVDPTIRWAAAACGLAVLSFAVNVGRASLALERAHLKMAQDDSDAAIPFLHEAAELDPTSADPIRDLGLIQINRQYEDMPLPVKLQYQALALDNFEKVIAIHPFDWRVHLQAAECEMSLAWGGQPEGAGGRWERARAHCERALAIAPTKWETRETHARMRLNYAQYLVGEGELAKAYREALASLEEFLKVPDYFVEGAPRGHRAGIGAKAAKRLLERLQQ